MHTPPSRGRGGDGLVWCYERVKCCFGLRSTHMKSSSWDKLEGLVTRRFDELMEDHIRIYIYCMLRTSHGFSLEFMFHVEHIT